MTFKPAFLIAALLALQSFNAAATEWKTGVVIQKIQARPNGGFDIFLLPETDLFCTENGAQFRVFPGQNGQSAASVNITLEIVLTAFTRRRGVDIAYDVISGACYVANVIAYP